MRRILVALLLVALLASPAAALKKTLLVVPGELTYMGWLRLVVAGLVTEGGGSYSTLQMDANPDSVAAELARARASGEYGLVVFLCRNTQYLCHPTQADHGKGAMAKYCSINRNPIGLPTALLSNAYLPRYIGYTDKIYTGTRNSASSGTPTVQDSIWSRGAIGGGADSLWARLATGDSVLWRQDAALTERKHKQRFDYSPENGYPWTVDAWVKRGVGEASKAAPGKGSTILAWHVHASAYDAAELPGAGQDTVIYYIPNFSSNRQAIKDAEIKTLAALLKKYDCIKDIPVSIIFDDYAYANSYLSSSYSKAELWAATDALFQYCADNELPILVNTQYCKAGAFGSGVTAQDTVTVVANMAKWYANDYIRFGWHPSTLYTDAAKSSSYTIFTTWGDGATETGSVLLRDLTRDRYLLGTSGMRQYMEERNAVIFNAGDYNGIGGGTVNKTDTIFKALAAVGVRTFLVETPNSGYYPTGTNLYTMFYPHKKYPLYLDWTGDSAWVETKIVCVNYAGLASEIPGDSVYATPAGMTDSAIVNSGKPVSSKRLYTEIALVLFNSGRQQDARGSFTWDDAGAAQWPNMFNFELRGWTVYTHHSGCAIRKNGVYYNTGLLWLEHFWNNLRAFNNLAKKDAPTQIGNVFEPVFLTDADQRVGAK